MLNYFTISAERQLTEATKNSGHHLEVLRFIASVDEKNVEQASIRQAAAVHFKNIVKKGWDAEAEVCFVLCNEHFV